MNVYLKALLFLFSFSLFHFGYEITDWGFLTPFCGVNESVFQHLKMAFWGYLLVAVGEYLFVRKKIKEGKIRNFWYSRLLSTVLLPWIIFIVWYLLPALYGRAESLLLDLVWAVAVTYLSCCCVGVVEKEIEKIEFSLSTKYVISLLFLILGFLFVWFTYKLPWIDMFVNPEVIK